MKQLLKRILITNWKTSLCAGLMMFTLYEYHEKAISSEDMKYLMGVVVSAGLLAAKDGVREDKPVAREDIKED